MAIHHQQRPAADRVARREDALDAGLEEPPALPRIGPPPVEPVEGRDLDGAIAVVGDDRPGASREAGGAPVKRAAVDVGVGHDGGAVVAAQHPAKRQPGPPGQRICKSLLDAMGDGVPGVRGVRHAQSAKRSAGNRELAPDEHGPRQRDLCEHALFRAKARGLAIAFRPVI